MRSWLWKLFQIILVSTYLALQFALYLNMSSRLNDALLRIKNLEDLLEGRSGLEKELKSSTSLKEGKKLHGKVVDLPRHEHARLKRSPLESKDFELAALLKRLQFIESSISTNNTNQPSYYCLQGPPGVQGLPGRDGFTGNTGPPGREGRIGPPGRDGRPGANGRDGISGRDGLPGRDGVVGAQGTPGRNGAPGQKGDKGDIGPPGPPGIKGRRGKKGDIGPRGLPGPPGPGTMGLPMTGPRTRTTPRPTEPDKRLEPPERRSGGAVYIRWGREDCPGKGVSLVYKGQMAGSSSREDGSGSNFLCMPLQPFYARAPNRYKLRAHLYGVEYGQVDDIFLRIPGRPRDMNYHGVPCAVCRTLSRPSLIMVPARYVCPSNAWTREYHGYLMASTSNSTRSEFICVDADAGVAKPTRNKRTQRESFLTAVRGKCGTLPCPRYRQDWDLTCAVCTA